MIVIVTLLDLRVCIEDNHTHISKELMQCIFENRHLIKCIQFLTFSAFKTGQSTGNTQFVL